MYLYLFQKAIYFDILIYFNKSNNIDILIYRITFSKYQYSVSFPITCRSVVTRYSYSERIDKIASVISDINLVYFGLYIYLFTILNFYHNYTIILNNISFDCIKIGIEYLHDNRF